MFNSLKLSIVVTTKVLADVFADITINITADIATEAIASRLGYYFRGLDIIKVTF